MTKEEEKAKLLEYANMAQVKKDVQSTVKPNAQIGSAIGKGNSPLTGSLKPLFDAVSKYGYEH